MHCMMMDCTTKRRYTASNGTTPRYLQQAYEDLEGIMELALRHQLVPSLQLQGDTYKLT